MNIIPLKINPMQQRPDKGRMVFIALKNGKIIQASACFVYVDDKQGIVLYPTKGRNRLAIDENTCRGWWYL